MTLPYNCVVPHKAKPYTSQYRYPVSNLIEVQAVLEQERVLAKSGYPALPKLLRIRIAEPLAAEPADAKAREGATVSIPVLTGLCRTAEIVLMAAASLATGLLLRKINDVPPWGEFFIVSLIAIVVARAIAEQQQVYTLPALLDPFGQLSRLFLGIVAGTVASAGSIELLHDRTIDIPNLLTQPLAWALASGATLLAFRSAVATQLQVHAKGGRLSTRVALIGANASALQFIKDSRHDRQLSIIGIYDDHASDRPDMVGQDWIRGDVAALVALAQRQTVDAIVIALPFDATVRIAVMRRRLAGIAADIFLTADSAALSYAGARFTTLGQTPVLAVSSRPLKDWPAFKKAAFDRVSSACGLLLALPLIALVAALVKLDSRGPVIFRQTREGLNGQPFVMLKFRTMYHRPRDESVQATAQDRRVTRSGYWLRRFSLDELPQLWNVLRGDMSLVGPRPHLATTRAGDRLFSEVVPHYQARHRMKPGLTGWAQVQGLRGETRTEQDIADRVEQDLFYIDNWSLGLDLQIIARTLLHEIVSKSGRAY